MTRTTQTLPIETGGADIKNWPDSPRALAGRLRRAATFLRKVGIEIGFGRRGTGTRQKAGRALVGTVRTVRARVEIQSEASDADSSGNAPTVRANPLKTNAGTAADGADADLPPRAIQGPPGT